MFDLVLVRKIRHTRVCVHCNPTSKKFVATSRCIETLQPYSLWAQLANQLGRVCHKAEAKAFKYEVHKQMMVM